MSAEVASIAQDRPTKKQNTIEPHATFKGRIELKKSSLEECNSLLSAQKQHFLSFLTRLGSLRLKRPKK